MLLYCERLDEINLTDAQEGLVFLRIFLPLTNLFLGELAFNCADQLFAVRLYRRLVTINELTVA